MTGAAATGWEEVALRRLQQAGVDGVLAELCRQARSLLDGDRAGLGVPDGEELLLLAMEGRLPGQRGADGAGLFRSAGSRLPLAGSVAGHVLSTGVAQLVTDTSTHPRGGFPLNRAEGIRSSVLVPLVLPSGTTGAVLSVMSSRAGAMGPEQQRLLEQLLAAASPQLPVLEEALGRARARQASDGEQLYRTVLESLGEAVVVHGSAGQVLVHNRAALRLFGISAQELVGLGVDDAAWGLRELDGSALATADLPAVRALRDRAEERDRLLLLRRPAVPDRVVQVTALPRLDVQGSAFSVVVSFADVTVQHRLAEQAQEQARRLSAAMQLADLATWETTLGTDEWAFSELLHQVAGVPAGTPVDDAAVRGWLGPDNCALLRQELELVLQHGQPRRVTTEITLPDSSVRVVQVWLDLTCDEDGRPSRQWGVLQDVTERVRAMEHLQDNEQVFRLTFELAPIGMILLDVNRPGRVLRANAAFRTMIGRPGDDATDPLGLADWTRPEDLDGEMARLRRLVDGDLERDSSERTLVRADGSTLTALVTSGMARDTGGRAMHVLAHVMDVSERAAHARELQRLALTDGLTGLPNRRQMEDRLAQSLARLPRRDGVVGLVLLDLDHFKVVNDSLGHAVGDDLLVQVAARLRAAVRRGTTVARLGGDEFVAVVDQAPDRAAVEAVGARLLESLRAPFTLVGRSLVATASLGLAVSEGHGSPAELLRQADLALYRAKATGRDRLVGFDTELRTRVDSRLDTEQLVRSALQEGWLRLHLQPVVDLATSQQVGAEGLVRIQHPERGLLLPAAFVEVAEESGQISEIDRWVLRHAVGLLARRPGTRIAVNVSVRTLGSGRLAGTLLDALAEARVEPGRLDVELTESSLLTGVHAVAAEVARLRAAGCRVGLDDFGTGHSALSHLQAFELDFLKVDRSFISGLGRHDRQRAVVEALVGLAHAHRLQVVAEGVERQEQRELLRAMGCDLAQGWLFGRPQEAV